MTLGLVHFYRLIRPFGFWGPIETKSSRRSFCAATNESRRDLLLLIPVLPWQVLIAYTVTLLVIKQSDYSFVIARCFR